MILLGHIAHTHPPQAITSHPCADHLYTDESIRIQTLSRLNNRQSCDGSRFDIVLYQCKRAGARGGVWGADDVHITRQEFLTKIPGYQSTNVLDNLLSQTAPDGIDFYLKI